MELFTKLWESLEALFKKIRDAFSTRNWTSLAALFVALAFFTHPDILGKAIGKKVFYTQNIWLLVFLGLLVVGVGAVLLFAPKPPEPSLPSKVPAIKELLPFEEQDAEVFARLERQTSIQRCLGAIQDADFRFGILYSESGNGKTSFLKAGLRPQMLNPQRCVYVKFTDLPPLDSVRLAVAERLELPLAQLAQVTTFSALLTEILQADSKPVVFLFDQFEQYFLHLANSLEDDAFALELRDWYQLRPPLPVKILVSIRADFMDRLLDLQKVVLFELGDRASFRLEKFSPEQARNVWRVIAEQAQIPFDEAFALRLATHDLASHEVQGPGRTDQGRISPVNVQILAAMLVEQEKAEDRAFTEAAFNRLGGVDGLLERFLEQKLAARLTSTRREVAVKVLLALTDQERNVRAGVLTVAQIVEKKRNLPLADAQEAVEWLEKARLLTAVEQGQNERGYELAHERLIAPLLKVTRVILREAAKANQLLDRRVNIWLGDGRAYSSLLTLPEWLLIWCHRNQLVWGEQRQQKEELIARTTGKWRFRAGAAAGVLVVGLLGWVWWKSEPSIMYRSRRELHALARDRPADAKAQVMASQDYLLTGNYPEALAIATTTKSEGVKAAILDSVATKAGQLRDSTQAVSLLEAARQAAGKLSSEYAKATVFGSIAQAAGQLHDPARAVPLLEATRQAVDKLSNEYAKATVLIRIAQAAGQLHDPGRARQLLEAAQQAVDKLSNEYTKATVFGSIAQAAGQLHDPGRAVPLLEAARQAAVQFPHEETKAYVFSRIAEAYGQLHDSGRARQLLEAAQQAVQQAVHPEAPQFFNSTYKANVLSSIIQEAEQLHDPVQAVQLLETVQQVAAELLNHKVYGYAKANVLSRIAEAYGQLHDAARAGQLLEAALTTQLREETGQAVESYYETYKADVFSRIAQVAGQLHNPTRAMPLLETVQQVAAQFSDEKYKADVFSSIAQAAGQLHDPGRAVQLLEAARQAADKFSNEDNKAAVFSSIAQAAGQLHDPGRAVQLLEAARQAADKFSGEGTKATVLSSIAQAYTQFALWKPAYHALEDMQLSSKAAPLYQLLEAWQKQHPAPNKK